MEVMCKVFMAYVIHQFTFQQNLWHIIKGLVIYKMHQFRKGPPWKMRRNI